MLEFLFLPFQIAFDLIGAILDIVFGLVDLILGLVGGLLSLAMGVFAVVLIIGLLCWFFNGRRWEKPQIDESEDFVSFYHQK